VPIRLADVGGELIAQKDSFLCAAKGVSIGIAFQKRIGAGFFGGEGFIMQRLEGDGMCFVHAGGTLHERTLAAGETVRVDTGCIVAFQPGVSYDIQFVGGIRSAIFGGEGLFFATLTEFSPRPRSTAARIAARGRSWVGSGGFSTAKRTLRLRRPYGRSGTRERPPQPGGPPRRRR
jgi:hypothetical protein